MNAILLLALLTNDPFRFEPIPMGPAKLPAESAGNAATDGATGGAHDEQHAPADPRPVAFLHTVKHGCEPCDKAGDWWLENCDTFPIRIELVEYETLNDPPDWVKSHGVPLLHYPSDKQRSGWACTAWNPETAVATWNTANPGARLKATSSRATGASPFDQIAKFTGPSGSFTFKPDAPISTSLDDRTSIRFPSIQGRYTVSNGVVTLKLDPPLPTGEYRKFLRFGFQITGAAGPENVTPTTADVTIQTNRGPQKVTIQMEPVK